MTDGRQLRLSQIAVDRGFLGRVDLVQFCGYGVTAMLGKVLFERLREDLTARYTPLLRQTLGGFKNGVWDGYGNFHGCKVSPEYDHGNPLETRHAALFRTAHRS